MDFLFNSNIIPKQDMSIYSFPDDRRMIAVIEAGEVVHYIDNVAITHPRDNPVKVIKSYFDNDNKVNLSPGEYISRLCTLMVGTLELGIEIKKYVLMEPG